MPLAELLTHWTGDFNRALRITRFETSSPLLLEKLWWVGSPSARKSFRVTYSSDPIHPDDSQAEDEDDADAADESDVVTAVVAGGDDAVEAWHVLVQHVQQRVAETDDVHRY